MPANDIAVSIRNLSKAYTIAHDEEKHTTLAEAVLGWAKNPLKKIRTETFWALNDVSFDIKQGEVVGIIGRNGAGKSTLLKVLSRITEPTKGEIEIFGKVGSLLEVGTGFHPELTGRENVYLNGAILGMAKAEIRKQFDAIVEFAGVEKFLDTPVKRYSSGMYVRLAFAVAAHLDSDILIVDEVLAVGDTEFQKKCLGKMGEVASGGRTVLFVSHSMSAVESLCGSAVFLRGGQVVQAGVCADVINTYMMEVRKRAQTTSLRERTDRQGTGQARFCGFKVVDAQDQPQDFLKSGGDYTFVMEYERADGEGSSLGNVVGSIGITDRVGTVLLFRSSFTNENFNLASRSGEIRCTVRDLNLAAGDYSVMLFLAHGESEIMDFVESAAEITVDGGDYFGTGNPGLPMNCRVLARSEWSAN